MTPTRLGVHAVDGGVEVAVHAPHASAVTLCVDTSEGERRVPLPHRDGSLHHGTVEGAGTGDRYGFRVEGPGHDPDKLLLDPYGRAVAGSIRWHPSLWPGGGDSAPHIARSVVVETALPTAPSRPRVAWEDTIIYEAHVRGLTRTHPDVHPRLRGTYAGLAHPAVVGHLVDLGVTTVELMPIARFVHEERLLRMGLRQYWGYMPISFLAPHAAYAAATSPEGVVAEVQEMVASLHAAGLEVILDVVLNHTGEGPQDGPWLSLRGFDDVGYHRHRPDGDYEDVTGTGNTLDLGYAPALRLALDALRHWATDYGVDGFRFDLAATLLRAEGQGESAFLAAVAQDPVLSGLKLIAEPWDLGADGHRTGAFPHPWREWNDHYRDTVRDAWRGRPGILPDLATRLSGSSDLFGPPRPPSASVAYVTSHDGPTLVDLVTYEHKHNEANGEANRDGHHDRRAWNGGVEGPTDDTEVQDLRDRRRRSLLASLLVGRGVPMLAGGDEIGRTQQGNDNAYCQDTDLSWHDWATVDTDVLAFTRKVIDLRRTVGTLRPTEWPDDDADVHWLGVDGEPLLDWHEPGLTTLQLKIEGDPDILAVVHTGSRTTDVTLPPGDWSLVVDTARPDAGPEPSAPVLTVPAFTLVVLVGSI